MCLCPVYFLLPVVQVVSGGGITAGYEQEKTAKNLTPKGYAGFTRIHHIWTEGIPDVPKLFMGSPIQDRDMARGTLMALFLSTTVFPAETIQIPVYAETCVLLDDLMAGGWYA